MSQTPSCTVCTADQVELRRSYKRSRGAVVVGWILAVPSAIGWILAALVLIGSLASIPYNVYEAREEARSEMARAHVPAAVIDRAVVETELPERALVGLTESQREAVAHARRNEHYHGGAGTMASGFGILASFIVAIVALVLTAPAAMLLARRRELVCTRCGAVTPAL